MSAPAVLARILSLPALDQRMLGALAVDARELTRSGMVELFRATNVRDEKGRLFNTTDLIAPLDAWDASGLLAKVDQGSVDYVLSSEAHHTLLQLLLERDELREMAALVREWTPLRRHYLSASRDVLPREILLALYLPEELHELDALCSQEHSYPKQPAGDLLVQTLGGHPPAYIVERLGDLLATGYCLRLFQTSVVTLRAVGDGPLAYARAHKALLSVECIAAIACHLAIRGQAEEAQAMVAERADAQSAAARCFVHLTRGENDDARAAARDAVNRTRTKASRKVKGVRGWLSQWVGLALLTDTASEALALAKEQFDATKKVPAEDACAQHTLLIMQSILAGDRNAKGYIASYTPIYRVWSDWLLWALVARFAEEELGPGHQRVLEELQQAAEHEGFTWAARELGALRTGRASLSALYWAEEPWQRALRSLEAAAAMASSSPTTDARKAAGERLVWTLFAERDGSYQIAARIQTATASGWSAGRQVTWKKLFEMPRDAAAVSHEDAPVVDCIVAKRDPYGGTSYFPSDAAPLSLVGHPRVFGDHECRVQVEVVRGTTRLEIKEDEEQISITLQPSACHARDVVCERDGSTRVVVYALTDEQRAIARQIGRAPLRVPARGREVVQRVVARLVPHFAVASEVDVDDSSVEEIAADARLHVQLRRVADGLRVRVFVAPLGGAPTFAPGRGSERVLGTHEHERVVRTVRTTRDLTDETARYDRLLDDCPTLASCDNDGRELAVTDLESCLELLSELRSAQDIVVGWAEGKRLEIAAQRTLRDVRLRMTAEEQWLSAEGELAVDDTLKLTFAQLLERVHKQKSRFVVLDDGRYLALSDDLKRTLDGLAPLSKPDGDAVLLHPLALLNLRDLDEAQLGGDKLVGERLRKIREASALTPTPLPAFQASLRPYQTEGYAWLSRLAHWGAGACLADDMGLGKTLQTLALLVEHADKGPALVVAPMSVCENWLSEARRFAPTLRFQRLSAERERAIQELTHHDVLVCSYGLLQQEIDKLASVRFQVVVLDEAQAIKNNNTQRTKAALRLQGNVRVALTGTPMENHLGELWSVMRFLNPGLLGSAKQFEERFAKPIQRENDRAAAQLLKRVIRPFMLRRKKSEVLDDLPEKTVVTLRIEPSQEERALYAALREQALAKLQMPNKGNESRMQLLAELTKLRRAACHPALVVPNSKIESSKLAAFEELVGELRDGGHRALVFSQFVDHLTRVRERLDALGISYQYLDGSSTAASRAKSVEAFQAGEGELFLISLKAGGFGLNLTAADYVIHLDPWWNPAVEDQASDRAHRIGQTRPVTVYRMVMEGSIEEKILAMHAEKRDLADALLEGHTGAGALSVDELLALVRDAGAPTARASRLPRQPTAQDIA